MEELRYRENDRFFPIPENEKDIPAIWAEHFIDIPTRPTGFNILEGLCFDRDGKLFICNTPQSRIWKLDVETKELSVFADLPEHMMPSAVKIHKDGRIFSTVAGSDAIYRMDISSYEKISEESPTEWARVPGPNGITIGNNALYIAAISKDFSSVTEDTVIYRIPDLSNPKAEVLLDVPGLYDGVALSDDGKVLYYSDWNTESVGAIDLVSGEVTSVYQEKGIGPADIAQSGGYLYVPGLQGSRILEFAVE